MLHKFDKQAIHLHFVSACALEDVVGNQDRDGRVALQVVEAGYTLKVIERERRTFLWTSAPCTLHRFQLRHDAQNEVDGFHSLCFSCNAVPVAVPGFTPPSLLFLSTWRITWFLSSII